MIVSFYLNITSYSIYLSNVYASYLAVVLVAVWYFWLSVLSVFVVREFKRG